MLVTMDIGKITIPAIYAHTPPRKDKINGHLMHYIKHGLLKKDIVVTQKGMLTDGYCSYIVAVACGIVAVQCQLNTKRLKYGMEKNRSINNRKHKRKILYHRQGGKCAICGNPLQIDDSMSIDDYLTLDHILPVCRGGSNGLMNLQGLCRRCNHQKNDKMEDMEQ